MRTQKHRHTLTILLLGLGILFGVFEQVQAQSDIVVDSVKVGHEFGDEIRFRVRVESSDPIEEVILFFRDVNEQNTRIYAMTAEGDEYFYRYDASTNLLRPFSKLSISFLVRLENGEEFESKKYTYQYSDNRFAWQTREEGNLRVHWSSGDESFGQAALDVARNGLDEIATFFPVDMQENVDIYIYASPADLQDALFMGGEVWAAGHASPALGITLVSIAPGIQEKIAMQRQIPHELAHVLLYRHVGENYNRLPTWVLEGIATLVELYPNPDHALALDRAVANNSLIPVADLCGPFPRDASQAFLAYAESISFTRYLRENYGGDAFDRLILRYADGVVCEAAIEQVYGQPLSYIEARWQEASLGANLWGVTMRNLAPYFLILAIFLAYPLTQWMAGRKNGR